MTDTSPARVPPSGSLRELGLFNWAFCKLAARTERVPEMHLFTTLGQHRFLLKSWLPFASGLLYFGKLSKQDTELVILRVGQLRNFEYELQHHRKLARRRGIDDTLQAKIFEGPQAERLTDRQRALLTATDEFILNRGVSSAAWALLSGYLDRKQLIEFCLLAGHYDMLAATTSTLNIPLDFPD
jgi:alkylhydroperoxidase family enzyme